MAGVARDVMSQRFGALDGQMLYRLRGPQAYGDSLLLRFRGEPTAIQLAVRDVIRGMDREKLSAWSKAARHRGREAVAGRRRKPLSAQFRPHRVGNLRFRVTRFKARQCERGGGAP